MDSIWISYDVLPNWPSFVYDIKSEIEHGIYNQIVLGIRNLILEKIQDEIH